MKFTNKDILKTTYYINIITINVLRKIYLQYLDMIKEKTYLLLYRCFQLMMLTNIRTLMVEELFS